MSKQVPNELSQDGPDKLDKVFVVGAVKISIHLHSDWPVTVNELSPYMQQPITVSFMNDR